MLGSQWRIRQNKIYIHSTYVRCALHGGMLIIHLYRSVLFEKLLYVPNPSSPISHLSERKRQGISADDSGAENVYSRWGLANNASRGMSPMGIALAHRPPLHAAGRVSTARSAPM